MRKLIITIFIACVCFLLHAQAPLVKKWDARFGGDHLELLRAMQQTSDGGFLLGGYSRSGISGDKTQDNWDTSQSSSDYWVVKVDSLGIKQWDKRFGGSGGDALYSLQQTIDGGYILGGRAGSDDGDKTQPNWPWGNDFWVVKIDSFGNKEWDARFGGTNGDELQSLQQTRDGGYILGGNNGSGPTGDLTDSFRGHTDYLVIKIDAQGNKQWDKNFGTFGHDFLYVVRQTTDGGYLVGGDAGGDASFDKTEDAWGDHYRDFWIVKMDSLGNKMWDKRYGGYGQEQLLSLELTSDGGYILGGWSSSDIGGDKTQDNWGTGAGRDFWIVKIDSLGNKQWDKRYGSLYTDELYSLQLTMDGGYLLGGSTEGGAASGDKTQASFGDSQSWIVKTDHAGNIQWDFTFHTPEDVQRGYVVETKEGCYVLANSTNGGVGGHKTQPNWDPDEDEHDYWIAKFCDTVLMRCLSLEVIVSSFTEQVSAYGAQDGAIKIYVTGGTPPYNFLWSNGQTTDNAVGLPAGLHSVTVTDSLGCSTTISVAIAEGPTGISGEFLGDISVYPNPTKGTVTITFGTMSEDVVITLYDALNKKRWHQRISAGAIRHGHTFDLKESEPGVYLLNIATKRSSCVMKVIKY